MDAATDVMIECLDQVDFGRHPLVVDEETGVLAVALAARGAAPLIWNRRAVLSGNPAPQPWPVAVDATSAFVRLSKVKEALAMALHAAARIMAPGAPIVVFGANDEGVRSVAGSLDAIAEGVATLATKRHCRVIAGRRLAAIAGLKAGLADWRRVVDITIAGKARAWASYPGCFAKGGLDAGTRLLIEHLPPMSAGTAAAARVLDFAAGTGVIAAAVRAKVPGAVLDLLEIDSVALAAAQENVPGARMIAAGSLDAVGECLYDAILSNPPIHVGIAEDHAVLQALIARAPSRLKRGGNLTLVMQRRVRADTLIEAAFGNIQRVAETGEFRVLAGRKA